MSETMWVALIGVIGTLLASLIPHVFQLVQTRKETQRWYAEFYLPREIETISNLYAALVGFYNAYVHFPIEFTLSEAEKLIVHNKAPANPKGLPPLDPSGQFILKTLAKQPDRLEALHARVTSADDHFTQCLALATVYLDEPLQQALDKFQGTELQLRNLLFNPDEVLSVTDREVTFSSLDKPYDDAIKLLRGRLRPSLIDKISQLN